MPELPEVETIRRQLEPELIGAQVSNVQSHWSSKFTPALEVQGAIIEAIGRRGKYLLFQLDDGRELVAHLGMTGRFSIDEPATLPDESNDGPHVRATWKFTDGRRLVFNDIRRFGRLHVVEAGEYSQIATLHHMGPEPFSDQFSGEHLHRAIAKSSRAVKTQLLSQRPVAGVGNIYADEALFAARINPRTSRVGRQRCEDLAAAIKMVLQSGIDNGGTTLRDYIDADGKAGSNQNELLVYGRSGEPCVNCGEPLRHTTLDARTTTYCGFCQRC